MKAKVSPGRQYEASIGKIINVKIFLLHYNYFYTYLKVLYKVEFTLKRGKK